MLAVSITGEMVSIFRNRGFLTAGITVSKSRTHGTPTPEYSKKQLASLSFAILTLVLIFSFSTRITYADDSDFASGINWRITSDMELIIGETETDTFLYQYIDTNGKYAWYQYRTAIKKVSFLGNVKASSEDLKSMFSGCSSLTSIDLSGLDTSDATSMQWMFSNCGSLKSIDLSGLDTGKVNNMLSMFHGCSSLTSINLSRVDTSQVTCMDYMFAGCGSLTSLDLSGFDTSEVTGMGLMFEYCSSLTSLDLSGFDTSKVTAMSGMFQGCSSLASLDLSGFEASIFTKLNMTYMFSGCSSLTSLDLSGVDTSKATDMKYMFQGCSSLTSLDLSGFDTSKVTDMKYMFYGCSSLTSLDLSGFDTSKVTNMESMFQGCSSLTSLNLTGWDTRSVTSMNRLFYVCGRLTDIALDKNTIFTSGISTSKDNWTRYKLSDGTEVEGPLINKLYEYTGEKPGWYTTRCLKGHSYGEWETTKNATCIEEGSKERVCGKCGDKEIEAIPALGHAWNKKVTIDKEATCTEDGSKSIHCARCNATKDAELIPAIGHSWAEAVSQQPTEFSIGAMTHRCTRCGSAYYTAIPAVVLPTDLPKVSISKPAAAKKKLTVKWKRPNRKNLKKIQGIEMRVTGPGYDRIFTAGKKKTSKKISGLQSKQKYTVRVRAYKYINGVKHVSTWSAAKTVKIK